MAKIVSATHTAVDPPVAIVAVKQSAVEAWQLVVAPLVEETALFIGVKSTVAPVRPVKSVEPIAPVAPVFQLAWLVHWLK